MIRTPAFCSRSIAPENAGPTVSSRFSSGKPCAIPKRRPASGKGSTGSKSSPDMTASALAQSATLRASGPTESSVVLKGNAPSVGMRWRLGLKPVIPQSAAGMRTEPPVSLPIAISHMPSAAATAAPADDPPGTRARSRGLPGVPKCGLAPIAPKANSVMLVLATTTAPPARSRRTTGASAFAGGASSARIFEPARVGSPATSNRSLMLTMVPSSGPRETPCTARASAASAAARAVSA